MGSLEWATWALVVVSAVLAFATLLYAYYTKKMMLGAKEQTEALKALTQAIQNIPSGFEHAKTVKELGEKFRMELGKNQQKATQR